MSIREAAIAHRRFGLGAKPGEIQAIQGDPRGFVAAQLARPAAALLDDAGLEPSHVVFAQAQRAQKSAKAATEAQKSSSGATPGNVGAPGIAMPAGSTPAPVAPPPGPPARTPTVPSPSPPLPAAAPPQQEAPPRNAAGVRREAFIDEMSARIDRGIGTAAPFLERLVLFWSNHFCVSATKGPVRGLVGAYEREVVRPHVLGRFGDMLKASAMHPAMLIYLDNQLSIGPASPAGRNRGRGLNENLAREILELHTLGVDGGYAQNDVTNFARVLTGWTVGNVDQPIGEPGKFLFAPLRHEPGTWSVAGRRYANGSQRTGEQVLADLARHPATGRHIARKLARHFLADNPPPALVERLASTFAATEGDLAAVSQALVGSPELWSAAPRKVVPPYDFAISILRGFGVRPKSTEIGRLAAALGQPTWAVPSPKGWPDDDDAWMGPSAVRERLRIAEFVARQVDKQMDPRALAAELLGDTMSEETRAAIQRAESREQGFEMLAMVPEFLRR